tara:strand:- start:4537 stop:5004 length:468 start_codon:yes stop_codon:yes gene_type:complete
MDELPLVSVKNEGKYVTTHFPSRLEDDSFTAGFLEAMDFLQFLESRFSIASCHELWPPRGEYDRRMAFDNKGVLIYNHFWQKYQYNIQCKNKNCVETYRHRNGVHSFYESLDYHNRQILYNWYKREIAGITAIFHNPSDIEIKTKDKLEKLDISN